MAPPGPTDTPRPPGATYGPTEPHTDPQVSLWNPAACPRTPKAQHRSLAAPQTHPPPAPTASHRAAQNSPSAPQAPPQPHSDPPNPHSTSEPPQTHHFLTAPIAPHRAPPAPQSPPRPPSSPHSPHRAPPFPQSPHSTSQSLPSSPHILTAPPDPLHPLTAPIATHRAPPAPSNPSQPPCRPIPTCPSVGEATARSAASTHPLPLPPGAVMGAAILVHVT